MALIKTVGELKEALSQYPDETPIVGDGSDSGGYDMTFLVGLCVRPMSDMVCQDDESYTGLKAVERVVPGAIFIGGDGPELWGLTRKAR